MGGHDSDSGEDAPRNGTSAGAADRKRSSRSPKYSRNKSESRSRSRSPSRGRKYGGSGGHRSRSRSPEDGYRIHVGEIDGTVSEKDLEEAATKYGPINEIWLASYAPYFAFVNYKKREDAEDALRFMNGTYVRNCRVRVSMALPRRRFGGGGGGGGGGSAGYGTSGGRGERRGPPRYNNYDRRGYGGGSRSYRRSSSRDRRSRSRD